MRLEWNLTLTYQNSSVIVISDYDIGTNALYGLEVGTISETFNGVPTCELSILSQSDASEKAIERYMIKRATVLLERVAYLDNGSTRRTAVFAGFVDNVSTNEDESLLLLSCMGFAQLLQNPIGRKYSPHCDAVFGSSGGYLNCNYDTSILYHGQLTVVSVDQYEGDRIITTTDTGTMPFGAIRVLFDLSYLDNQYKQASLSANNVITLDEPLAEPPAIGTKLTITKSCTKLLSNSTANACVYFNNTANFKGHPYLIERQTAITPYVYTILPTNKKINLN